VTASLRCEIFPADVNAAVGFYTSRFGAGACCWGLRDFRVLDPSGYYWRITTRA
jgi:hypothetical protein